MITCPQCHGFGWIGDAFGRVHMDCELCHKTGEVSDRHALWISRGKWMKNYRLDVMMLTLREAARKYHVDASNLSKMERGIISPKIYWRNRQRGQRKLTQREIGIDVE